MIPSHELRIGNWIVNNHSGEYVQIKKGVDIDNYSKDFSSIPITAEVLEQCGFAFDAYHKLWRKNQETTGNRTEMELDRDFWMVDFSKRRMGVAVTGLHQLQNLFFLLKGRELAISEKIVKLTA